MTLGERLEAFVRRSGATAYVEPASDLHTQITRETWERIKPQIPKDFLYRVLDVGCGSGLALDMFLKENIGALGITCVPDEFEALARELKHWVCFRDMHDICDFSAGLFQLVWMRHVAEHSPIPSFLLHCGHCALEENGYLYLEVPNPDTACHHESNPDHRSVMGDRMWGNLLIRAGFEILDSYKLSFAVQAGSDSYSSFLCKKVSK